MSDPFDAFSAFETFDPIPEDEDPRSSGARSAPNAEPASEPTLEEGSTGGERLATRRWSAPRRSLGTTERPSTRPASDDPAQDAATAPEPAAEIGPEPTADVVTSPGAPPAPVDVIRAVGVPEFRAAVTRLRSHGHDAEVSDELEDEGEPRLAMRFRPDRGPLGRVASGPGSHARLEIRLSDDTATDLELIAGYSPAAAGTGFILLGSTPLHALTPEWVTQRIVDFVARTLHHD